VSHGYEIDGAAQERTFEFPNATDYRIQCTREPENRYIAFAAPSLRV
jgi:hypothetical protein